MDAQAMVSARPRIPRAGINAMALRNVRSYLQKGEWGLISGGGSLTRIQAVGSATHVTTKHGARMDVTPDPAYVEDEWILDIRIAQAAWPLRCPEYVGELPAVRLFRRIAADEDWPMTEFPADVPNVWPSLILESSETIDGSRDCPTAAENPIEGDDSGVSARYTLRAMRYAFSSLTVAAACARYRWRILPFVFSKGDGAVIWIVDFESCHVANFTAVCRGFLSIAHGTWNIALSLFFWIDGGVIISLFCFALYNLWKMRGRCLKCRERSMAGSETGSLGSPNGTPAAGNLISPIRISSPSLLHEVPPPACVGAFSDSPAASVVVFRRSSLLKPGDDWAGAFSSISSRQRCLAAVRPPSPVAKCCARKISPAGGTSCPPAALPCLEEEGISTLLRGDEIAMIDDSPNRTHGTGGSTYLCADRKDAYDRRSWPYRRSTADCF